MNDTCNVSELLYTIMYTDYTSVIMSCNDLKTSIQFVNSELYLLNTWLKVDHDTSIRMNNVCLFRHEVGVYYSHAYNRNNKTA